MKPAEQASREVPNRSNEPAHEDARAEPASPEPANSLAHLGHRVGAQGGEGVLRKGMSKQSGVGLVEQFAKEDAELGVRQ
jgi:hypothetical protein